MDNAQYDTSAVAKCCTRKLAIDFSVGKHLTGWAIVDGKKTGRISVPKGRKPIPPKTYKNMADGLFLSIAEFDSFLECTLSGEACRKLLVARAGKP